MRNGVQYGVDTADVLSTVAECDASASGGKGTTQVASAKALSELNSNLGGVTFGRDGDGNPGYHNGDGTIVPFREKTILYKDGTNYDLEGASRSYLYENNGYQIRDIGVTYGDKNIELHNTSSYSYAGVLSKTAYDITNKTAFGFKSSEIAYYPGSNTDNAYKHGVYYFCLVDSADRKTIRYSFSWLLNSPLWGNQSRKGPTGCCMNLDGITGTYYLAIEVFSQVAQVYLYIDEFYLI